MKERNMILANIGSGSSYLPDIAEMLIERRDKMPIKEWRLMDIDEYLSLIHISGKAGSRI